MRLLRAGLVAILLLVASCSAQPLAAPHPAAPTPAARVQFYEFYSPL